MNQTLTAPKDESDQDRRYIRYVGALIGGLLIFRLAILFLNPAGLHGDEAQYWAWAQEPAFGYYSKPPLIAWIIWTTTAVFGDAEWAVRLASPFLHSGTAILLFLSARHLYGARAGCLAAALYILMPGVGLSASLISTDAALLLCISLFLYAWIRLRDGGSWRWSITLGLGLGLGFLAKYAMVYVLPAFALALIFDRRSRAALVSLRGVLAASIAVLMIVPNMIWNARNDFATLVHTGDNANLSDGAQLNPIELAEFFMGQFAVFGPLTFALLLIAIWQNRGVAFKIRGSFAPWLTILVLTPLLVISVQALLSRANANWAAAAYAAAPIVLASWAIRNPKGLKWVLAGLMLNFGLNLGPSLIATSPTLVDRVGLANSVKRQRAWPETVLVIENAVKSGDYEAIAVDNRLMFYALNYYGMNDTAPLFMWRYEPRLNSHAELTHPLPQDDRSVLIASYYKSYEQYFARDFETISPVKTHEIDLGGGKRRTVYFYAASGYKGPVFRD